MPGEQRSQNTTIDQVLTQGGAGIGISYITADEYSILTSCQLSIVGNALDILVNEYWAWDITLEDSLLSELNPREGPTTMTYASHYLKHQ